MLPTAGPLLLDLSDLAPERMPLDLARKKSLASAHPSSHYCSLSVMVISNGIIDSPHQRSANARISYPGLAYPSMTYEHLPLGTYNRLESSQQLFPAQ